MSGLWDEPNGQCSVCGGALDDEMRDRLAGKNADLRAENERLLEALQLAAKDVAEWKQVAEVEAKARRDFHAENERLKGLDKENYLQNLALRAEVERLQLRWEERGDDPLGRQAE